MGMIRAQIISNYEKTALRILHRNKNIIVIINDTDKNVGLACAKALMKKEFKINVLKKKLNS